MTEKDRRRLERFVRVASLEVIRWEADRAVVRTPYGTKGEATVKVSGQNFRSSSMLPLSSRYGMHMFNEKGVDIIPSF